jgi:hypothetical protein
MWRKPGGQWLLTKPKVVRGNRAVASGAFRNGDSTGTPDGASPFTSPASLAKVS